MPDVLPLCGIDDHVMNCSKTMLNTVPDGLCTLTAIAGQQLCVSSLNVRLLYEIVVAGTDGCLYGIVGRVYNAEDNAGETSRPNRPRHQPQFTAYAEGGLCVAGPRKCLGCSTFTACTASIVRIVSKRQRQRSRNLAIVGVPRIASVTPPCDVVVTAMHRP